MDQFPVNNDNGNDDIIAIDRMKLKVIHTRRHHSGSQEVRDALAEAFGGSGFSKTGTPDNNTYFQGNKS